VPLALVYAPSTRHCVRPEPARTPEVESKTGPKKPPPVIFEPAGQAAMAKPPTRPPFPLMVVTGLTTRVSFNAVMPSASLPSAKPAGLLGWRSSRPVRQDPGNPGSLCTLQALSPCRSMLAPADEALARVARDLGVVDDPMAPLASVTHAEYVPLLGMAPSAGSSPGSASLGGLAKPAEARRRSTRRPRSRPRGARRIGQEHPCAPDTMS
jgi:hypothetical protein